MHRLPAAILCLLLVACVTREASAPPTPESSPAAAPSATVSTPPNPAPATVPATPAPPARPSATPSAEVPQLEPGHSDEPLIDGEPALLAIGDSVAAGTGLPASRDAFVWRVHRALSDERGGSYGLVNLAVPGATSSTLNAEQLDAAVAALSEARVDTVVISIGGNDLLGLLDGACRGLSGPGCAAAVTRAVDGFAANLEHTLGVLSAAGGDARIVLLGVYNPFDFGLGTSFERLAADAALALNAAGARVAARHGVLIADGLSALAGDVLTLTAMGAAEPDIHPTALGHDRLARAVLDALDP